MLELLELIAATTWFWTFSIGFLVSIITSIALLFCPLLRWFIILYVIWIWYDRKTSERGGRPIGWIRDLIWWRYMGFYFNHKLISTGSPLDPKKNYLFACFPHGIFPVGPFASFVNSVAVPFSKHQTYTTALDMQFLMPFTRELFLSIGAVSVSGPSIKHLLNDDKGGNIVSILIGGGDEAKYSKPGKYKIILNQRKGFVKMALQTGSPIVPVITFGETDVYDQLDFPGFGCIRDAAKSLLQIGLVIPKGRFLVCPNRVPVVTVAGEPIDVEKVDKPTNEQVDQLHQQFVESLKKLFDQNKERYVKDPDNTVLEIV